MCGISGYCSSTKAVNLDEFYCAHKLLAHRGPDDEGFVVASNDGYLYAKGDDTIDHFANLPHLRDLPPTLLVMGNRRLKILDLSWHGHQPMSSRDSRYTIVFNGEIYNYRELKKELMREGHQFESSCDTEVLLAAFAQWKLEAFDKLNGMWALAIYDKREKELTLCRDRFGIKPLYYTLHDGTITFASEVKTLLHLLGRHEFNEQQAIEYLVFSTSDHEPETLFSGVKQVLPGHLLTIKDGKAEHKKWWEFSPSDKNKLSYQEAQEKLYELFSNAIDLRLRSDVPVGVALSGGLDSTSIACEMAHKEQTTDRFHAFSAVYDEKDFSERKYIEETIRKTNFKPHWIVPKAGDIEAAFDDVLYYQEFPFRSISIVMQALVMNEVKQNSPTVVLLEGQGSDEVFGGYTNQMLTYCTELVRSFSPFKALNEGLALIGNGSVSLHQVLRALIKLPIRSALGINERYVSRPYLSKSVLEPKAEPLSDNLFLAELFSTLTYRAMPEYLRYSDRNSMAYSLESRLPYLDFELVQWAFTLPNDFKIRNGVGKMILRDAMRKRIPPVIAERRDKMGFITPQRKWQRESLLPWMARHLTKDNLSERFSFLDGKEAAKLVEAYKAGTFDDMGTVWRLFCLSAWHEMWIENRGERQKS